MYSMLDMWHIVSESRPSSTSFLSFFFLTHTVFLSHFFSQISKSQLLRFFPLSPRLLYICAIDFARNGYTVYSSMLRRDICLIFAYLAKLHSSTMSFTESVLHNVFGQLFFLHIGCKILHMDMFW